MFYLSAILCLTVYISESSPSPVYSETFHQEQLSAQTIHRGSDNEKLLHFGTASATEEQSANASNEIGGNEIMYRRKRRIKEDSGEKKNTAERTTLAAVMMNTTEQQQPLISPLVNSVNSTIWHTEQDLKRNAQNAMLCLSFLMVLLFVCVLWSGMLKNKNNHLSEAQDGSWQSAERKDRLFNVNIKELLQSKLRNLHFPKVRPKRKRKGKGGTYLELKQKERDMSSTSEEDFYAVS